MTLSNDLMDAALLAELVKDEDHYVRYSVTINLLTSPIHLIELPPDEGELVRRGRKCQCKLLHQG